MSQVPPLVALMLTRRCNMTCGHCSVASGPQVRGEPETAELLDYLRQAAAAGVRSVQLTGGEPMLREQLVLQLLRECRRLGLAAAMTTNGFWGLTLADARRHLKALRRAGLGLLTVSYDRYHAEFQDLQPVLNIARSAEALNVPTNINIVRLAADPELPRLIAPFEGLQSVRLRFYDVQPVGRARRLPADALRHEVEGFCSACAAPAITDDGRLTACNGPSYFAGRHSPLQVGSLRQQPLAALLERHWNDPILGTIRTFGPSRLRDELKRLPGFETFPFRERYHGMCDLCHQITSSAEAVAALRTRLVQPPVGAERHAVWQVIDGHRKGGALSREHVNGIGACRTFLRAAWEPGRHWPPETEQILGRADLDWRHQTAYLSACGLARPLLGGLEEPALTRWAPSFFSERLRAGAIRDGLGELMKREALRRIADTLRAIGSRGVLLKGSAILVLEGSGAHALPIRATGDIDLYVDPPLAPVLRGRLLDVGFSGAVDAARSAPHHLAPVTFQGLPVEIHTAIMPAFWGLPEREMLAHVCPVNGMDPLDTLDPEGFLLHAGMHASTHLFTHGLKTAWDLLWVLERFEGMDWDRLTSWVQASRMPRGFWVPVRVLCRELEIPLPQEFLGRGPVDRRQRQLETIARARLFSAMEGAFDLNPFSKTGVFLLLQDSWRGWGRYLAALGGREAAEARRSARHTVPAQAFTRFPQQLRQALLHWRQYRRALARTTADPRA